MGSILSFLFKSKPRVDSNKGVGKWRKHYSSCHKILLVGEADFSFALCLARTFGSAINIVATSVDSKAFTLRNYCRAASNLEELDNLGCTIMHGIDAHTMWNDPLLLDYCFDRIVFNFSQAGFGFIEHKPHKIELHKEFVKMYLQNSKIMLERPGGEVHVTLKNDYPFCKLDILKVAEEVGLVLVEKVPFEKSEYPSYINKRGSGYNCDSSFTIGDCTTFKFLCFLDTLMINPVTLKFKRIRKVISNSGSACVIL